MPDARLEALGYASQPKLFEITGDCVVPRAILGYTHCLPTWSLPSHVHACYELHLAISGRFVYEAHVDTYRLEPGDLCVTRPGEIHRMSADSDGPSEVIHLQFDSISASQIASVFEGTNARSVRSCHELIAMLQEAIAELEHPGPLARMLVSSLICQSLIRIGRRIWHAQDLMSTAPRYTADSAITNVLWYLESNCRHGITLDELARIAGVSKSSLSHRFAKEMNESVGCHSQRMVMQKARMLVEEGHLQISEIAELLGFPSPNYFSSAFRKHFGVSPSTYRAHHNPPDARAHR